MILNHNLCVQDHFIEVLSGERGFARHSLEAYRRDIQDWLIFLGQTKVEEARDTHSAQYMDVLYGKQLKPRTIARKLSALRQLYHFLQSEGRLTGFSGDAHGWADPVENLFSSYETPRFATPLPKCLSQDQMALLLESARADKSPEGCRLWLILELLYATGMRISELLDLKIDMIPFVWIEDKNSPSRLKGLHSKAGLGKKSSLPKDSQQQFFHAKQPLASGHQENTPLITPTFQKISFALEMTKKQDVAVKKSLEERSWIESYAMEGLSIPKGFHIRGKGNKERFVYLTPYVYQALQDYLPLRHFFIKDPTGKKNKANPLGSKSNFCKSNPFLFPSWGKEQYLTRQRAGQLLKEHGLKVGLDQRMISPHVIRHSFATHLLSNGMDLRSLQQLLGHQNIETTQIYTHVFNQDLYDTLRQCHPLSVRSMNP
jgi:site-specific recombinase XerD